MMSELSRRFGGPHIGGYVDVYWWAWAVSFGVELSSSVVHPRYVRVHAQLGPVGVVVFLEPNIERSAARKNPLWFR